MRYLVFASLLVLAVAVAASAQTEQQISGTVSDSTGAAVPSAAITVTNEGTGASRNTTANSEGYYVVPNLPVGTYTIVASAAGFKRFVSQNVTLSVGSKPSVNARLEVGQVSETVEVQAQALQVETTTGEVGHLVTASEALSPATERAQLRTACGIGSRNLTHLFEQLPGALWSLREQRSCFLGERQPSGCHDVPGK